MEYGNMIHKILEKYQVVQPMIQCSLEDFFALGIMHFISEIYIKTD